MSPEHRQEQAVDSPERDERLDAPEEAPAGASSDESAPLTAEEERQHAGAATYADGPDPQAEDDGGLQVQLDLHELATKAEILREKS